MKRWVVGWGIILLACVGILLQHPADPYLLQDTDTQVILKAIRGNPDWLRWFEGDWPLQNHFYRPIPSLLFHIDNHLYGANAGGYGFTNACLCIAAVLGLFWLVREMSDSVLISTGATLLFASWIGYQSQLLAISPILDVLPLGAIICFLWPGRNRTAAIWAFSLGLLVVTEVRGMAPLGYRILDWLPGRTASSMAVFALLSLAAFSRYVRTCTIKRAEEFSPLSKPATSSTTVTGQRPEKWWLYISWISCCLSLMCYEQAVILPGLATLIVFYFRKSGQEVKWQSIVPFWILLILYVLIRRAVVPSEISGYQAQQMKTLMSACYSLMDYFAPALYPSIRMLRSFDDVLLLLTTPFWRAIGGLLFELTALLRLRDSALIWTSFAMSILAFLPMAFLKPFEHYHMLPMAFRSVYVVGLIGLAWKWLTIAMSRPILQAPPRRDPAPGSLLHP